MMRYIIAALLFITASAFTVVSLKPVDSDEAVTFTIKNFGINTNGELKGLKGIIQWDEANPAASSFNITADVNTINTGISSRDTHLKKTEYFNVATYPVITFKSTAVTSSQVTGSLSIKGVTKNISFPYTVSASGNGYVFKGNFSINRQDYGVGGGSAVLSSTVNVQLNVKAEKQ